MSRALLLGGAVAALVLFVVVPLLALGGALVGAPEALAAWTDPLNLAAARNTVVLSVGVLGFALVFGVPLGFLVGRTDLPAAGTWRALAMVPYVVPPYVTAIAWIALLNPTNGWINVALAKIGLPAADIYGLGGMIWVMGLESTPFVMLATAEALARMDASLEEQARIAGAGPWAVIRRVTLPLATPAVLEACAFVLSSAAAAFSVPYLLAAGTSRPDFVLTTRVLQALDLDPARGRPVAVALSLGLLLVGVGLPLGLRALRRRGRVVTVAGKATRPSPFRLGRARPWATLAIGAWVTVAAGLPLATIALTSVLVSFGRGFGPSNWTLANYAAVWLGRSDALPALARSVALAAAAATVAVAIGALLAWMRARTDWRGRGLPAALGRLPWAIPGTVLALGLLLAWSQDIRVIVLERVTITFALADTAWMLGLAYVIKHLAFPIGQADAGLAAVDPALEEAARLSGAGFATTLRRVTAPLLRDNLLAAWLLVFVPSFSEVTMSILLAGPDTRVIGTLLFDLQTYGDPPAAAVVAVVVTAVALVGNAALRRVVRA